MPIQSIAEPIRSGDRVRFRSGSPEMLVVDVESLQDVHASVTVAWKAEGVVHEKRCPIDALVRA